MPKSDSTLECWPLRKPKDSQLGHWKLSSHECVEIKTQPRNVDLSGNSRHWQRRITVLLVVCSSSQLAGLLSNSPSKCRLSVFVWYFKGNYLFSFKKLLHSCFFLLIPRYVLRPAQLNYDEILSEDFKNHELNTGSNDHAHLFRKSLETLTN